MLPLVLGGCASTVVTQVTSYNRWPQDAVGAAYVFRRSAAQDDSLEHQRHEAEIAAALGAVGLVSATEAVPPRTPRFEVAVDTRIEQRDRRVVDWVPIGTFGPGLRGGFYGGPGWGAGWGPMHSPFWGGPWGGSVPVERTLTRFLRSLKIDIYERAGAAGETRKVFESTAVSEGNIDNLGVVMPYLVRSVFSDFPGADGVTRRVELPLEGRAVPTR